MPDIVIALPSCPELQSNSVLVAISISLSLEHHPLPHYILLQSFFLALYRH